MRVTFVRSERV